MRDTKRHPLCRLAGMLCHAPPATGRTKPPRSAADVDEVLATVEAYVQALLAGSGADAGDEGDDTLDEWADDAPVLAGLATVHAYTGALMWSSQHLNRYVVRKQWRCWDGRNAYSRCAADARRTTDCTSAHQ